MKHSESLMQSRKHRILYKDPVVIPLLNNERAREVESEAEGDSYINADLSVLMEQRPGYGVIHRRAWEAKGSASATASNIRNGKFSGHFGGQTERWNTRVIEEPTDPSLFTILIWRLW